jgi:hypothetical protein
VPNHYDQFVNPVRAFQFRSRMQKILRSSSFDPKYDFVEKLPTLFKPCHLVLVWINYGFVEVFVSYFGVIVRILDGSILSLKSTEFEECISAERRDCLFCQFG